MSQEHQKQHDQEVILWLNEITKSVWHKLHTKHTKIVIQTQEITNYNVVLSRENEGTIKIPLIELDDVLIINNRTVNQGIYSGFSSGRFFCSYYGFSSSNSRQVGDLVFLRGGKPEIIFRNIATPDRLASLVKAEKKKLQQLQNDELIDNIAPIQEKFRCYQYHDKTGQKLFQINRPLNFIVITDHEAINRSYVVILKATPLTSLAAVGISILDNDKDLTLDAYANTNIETLFSIEKAKNFHLLESINKATLGGEKAHMIVYNGLINNVYSTHLKIIAMHNNKIYSILFNCDVNEYQQYLPTVTRMIESFTFIDRT
ncbi:MAG TPA: hypothetical protein VFI73_06715 [Candidatus Nitrosopolaris sp.]|nr:hypothetical protein [Candidatus Nitrosopolaris sp.]